jgi:N-acetyl-1-D-myo-inositol-2-amino-2-deoxy-alpha-D-glucopyranoside deacetylase
VHAHPDDETITMGGTLARYSAAGVRTIVVTCTTGDLGEVLDPALLGQDVASLRASELRAACDVLGVSRVIQLGYGDSGMAGTLDNERATAFCRADLAEVTGRLVGIVAEEHPDVMVAYDETGGYGHPDHVRSHQAAVAAYMAAPPAIRPLRLYLVRFPLRWSREFVRSLREAGIEAPGSAPTGADAGPSVAEIGVPDDLVTTIVDVGKFVPAKLAALACHASQMPPDHFLRCMPLPLAQRLWSREFFSRQGGPPETDLFDALW